MGEETKDMAIRIVTVVGASGTLGSEIVRALLEKGARVRAMVRATSNRTKLESLGVTEFVVADLMDATSLQRALTAEPRAEAVIASAAGFTAHSARTRETTPGRTPRGIGIWWTRPRMRACLE
jgi:nucleoside-diphosphate-sugar epimerase